MLSTGAPVNSRLSDDVIIGAGKTVSLNGSSGTQTVQSIACEGDIVLGGGRLDVGVSTQIDGTLTITNNAIFGGAGVATVGGSVLAGQGNLVPGGAVTVSGTATISPGNDVYIQRDMILNGTTNWTETGRTSTTRR